MKRKVCWGGWMLKVVVACGRRLESSQVLRLYPSVVLTGFVTIESSMTINLIGVYVVLCCDPQPLEKSTTV